MERPSSRSRLAWIDQHYPDGGTTIAVEAVGDELNGDSDEGTMMDGIGTLCHEFSHCLGLPDWYESTYGYFGMGDWSLMDHGCYNSTLIDLMLTGGNS